MSETVLEVKNLVKNFGQFRALDGISLSVPRGKIIGGCSQSRKRRDNLLKMNSNDTL